MARKTKQDSGFDDGQRTEIILDQPMETVIHNSMLPYAEYVILDRALPRVEDGLKPVQRRILYTMMELGLTPDKPHRKCARIVGDALGKYHPHGDTSVYDALVRMAQDFIMRDPLVDGHGNFGSIDGDTAAAMRYTEARMTPLAMELLRDIDKSTVDFRLNFDDTLQEPEMLPGRFPNLLVNGASGIAVGLATNIPPHNLGEVIDGVIAQIEDPEIPLDRLMRHVKGPDFPTGGLILDTSELEKAYQTGRGRVMMRAKTSIEPGNAGRSLIVIHEIPYQVNKAALLEKILKLSEEKKQLLSGIYDIRDESDRTGMRAVIEIKKDADPEKILQVLYKYSQLQLSFGVNMVAIADGKPQQLGLKEINRRYIDYQKRVLTRRTQYELDAAKTRMHMVEGLIIAVEDIDRVIALIRASKTPKEAREALMQRYELSQVQAQAILDMRLQRLTGLEVLALKKEHAELRKKIQSLESILGSEQKLLRLIQSELMDIRNRYATPRRTQFATTEDEKEIKPSDFVIVEPATVLVTYGGYIKRLTGAKAKPKEDAKAAFNPDDVITLQLDTSTEQKLLALTSKGNALQLDVSAIPDAKQRDRGMPVVSLVGGLEEGERILTLLPLEPSAGDAVLLFYTTGGLVKASRMEEYLIRRSKFAAIGLKGKDEVLHAELLQQDKNILLITRRGMAIQFKNDTVPVAGRTAQGVKGIQLEIDDAVAFARQIEHGVGEVVTLSERGYAKRSLALEFDLQNRNGKGLKTMDFKRNASNGSELIYIDYVCEPFSFAVLQKKSEPTLMNTEDIPIDPRFSKGRPVIMALMEDVITGCIRLG